MIPQLAFKVADVLGMPDEGTLEIVWPATGDGPSVISSGRWTMLLRATPQRRIAVWDREGQVLIDAIPCATISCRYGEAVGRFSVLFNRNPHLARMVVLTDRGEHDDAPLLVAYRIVLHGISPETLPPAAVHDGLARTMQAADLATRALDLLARGVAPDDAFDFVCQAAVPAIGILAGLAGANVH